MKNFYTNLLFFFLATSLSSFSQVGIGTTTPTSELQIGTEDTGIPALGLDPQSTPVGDTTGQLAVIGDQLYMFDATRDKWLSVETTALQFGSNGSKENEYMRFGGDSRNSGSGAMMPFDGTIVYTTINISGGDDDKGFDIQLDGSNIGNSGVPANDGRPSLSSNVYTETTHNLDFDAGQYINIYIRNNGSDVDDTVAILWVKWRKENP